MTIFQVQYKWRFNLSCSQQPSAAFHRKRKRCQLEEKKNPDQSCIFWSEQLLMFVLKQKRLSWVRVCVIYAPSNCSSAPADLSLNVNILIGLWNLTSDPLGRCTRTKSYLSNAANAWKMQLKTQVCKKLYPNKGTWTFHTTHEKDKTSLVARWW